MNTSVADRARAVVEDRLGWAGGALDPVRLEGAIHTCAAGLQQTHEGYVQRIEQGSGPEFRALVSHLAVGETYFFRDRAQFAVLDQLLQQTGAPLRVLCAGCASGEEPYSVAIQMLERGVRGQLLGIDVNPIALQSARDALYSSWSLRETPRATVDTWFERRGKRFALSEAPRSLVELRPVNLYADRISDLGEWDIVLCRNVLMYHGREAAAEIVSKLARQLIPGGYLFLGHAETLRGLSEDFEVHQASGTFFYRRAGKPPPRGIRWLPDRQSAQPAPSDAWPGVIGSATDRIAALARQASPASIQNPETTDWTSLIHERIHRGQPITALELLDTFPQAIQAEFEVVRAALLLMTGRALDAQRLAEHLIRRKVHLPEAHYVLALCKSQAGSTEEAVQLLQRSHALAPEFAMSLVQAGLHMCRLGDVSGGQRILQRAANLLENETEHRLILFGGGFSRSALQRICRAPRRGAREAP